MYFVSLSIYWLFTEEKNTIRQIPLRFTFDVQIKIWSIALIQPSDFFWCCEFDRKLIFRDMQFEASKWRFKNRLLFKLNKKNRLITSSTNLTASQIKSYIYDCLFAWISNEIPNWYDRDESPRIAFYECEWILNIPWYGRKHKNKCTRITTMRKKMWKQINEKLGFGSQMNQPAITSEKFKFIGFISMLLLFFFLLFSLLFSLDFILYSEINCVSFSMCVCFLDSKCSCRKP